MALFAIFAIENNTITNSENKMWNYCDINDSYKFKIGCIYDSKNNIDFLEKYEIIYKNKINKYNSNDIENLINENDREDNDQDRIWCVFVKHQNNYIPICHWDEFQLLNVEMNYANFTNKSSKWGKKITHIYRVMVRDEEEREYNKQTAIIYTLLIFEDNTYEILLNESFDNDSNNNYCKLFELPFNDYDNINTNYNIIGFGDNIMLCLCMFDDKNFANANINKSKINNKSELFYSNLQYEYDDFEEFFYQ